MTHRAQRSGFSLIEVLVASAIITTVVVGVVGALRLYASTAAADAARTQAALQTQETAEVLQILRDEGWSDHIANLSLGVSYQLAWNGSSYQATTSPVLIDGIYQRSFTLSAVHRDSNDNVAASGAVDNGSRLATITITRAGTTLMTSQVLLHDSYSD